MKTKGIYFLYRALQALALPFLLLYFVFRGPKYCRTLKQRFGFLHRSFRQTGPGAIWLHAVSVGEVLSCVEFVHRLRLEFPRSKIFVSSTTLTGHTTAVEKFGASAFYAPVDYVWAVRRILRTLQPSVVLIAETEIWPNLFREVKRTGAGLMVVNGRISDVAYPKYERILPFLRHILPQIDQILAQNDQISERFRALGALPERVQAAGNFKFDFEPRAAVPGSPVLEFVERLHPKAVWIAASTMPPAKPGDIDEDDAVIAAYQQLARPDVLLILVPRRPERFDAVARKLEAAGIPYVRRSALNGPAHVLLLDTIGELSGLFGIADVVFIGGTLAEQGGHNVLEPAFFGKPVIVGPHMENFRSIAEDFRAAAACVEIRHEGELASAVARLLDKPDEARAIGARAKACGESKRGATGRAVEATRALYDAGIPRYRPAQPWYAVARLLSYAWSSGGRRRHARAPARQRKLPVPVVSVGNLTMGGTGKTPCVLRLAEEFKAAGKRPGILTRGYRRGSVEKVLIVPPGASVRAEHSGDEPQMFVRSGLAPVGIGADRFAAGTALLRQFDCDLALLDDGFQHVRLARNVDIVLIDALQPFGGGELFPVGRLREPVAALARADIVVITRSEYSDLGAAIEREVRRWNERAPLFRSGVSPRAWVQHRTGKEYPAGEPPFGRAGAFCGLGNPQSFRRTLAQMGMEPVDWVEFEDHHRYRPQELQRIARQMASHGAEALATTEKDAVNLCQGCDDLVAPLPLYWLKAGMTIEREGEFFETLLRLLGHEPGETV